MTPSLVQNYRRALRHLVFLWGAFFALNFGLIVGLATVRPGTPTYDEVANYVTAITLGTGAVVVGWTAWRVLTWAFVPTRPGVVTIAKKVIPALQQAQPVRPAVRVTDYYVRQFERIAHGQDPAFNWGAALSGPLWAIDRGLYIAAATWFIAGVLAVVFTAGIALLGLWVLFGFRGTRAYYQLATTGNQPLY